MKKYKINLDIILIILTIVSIISFVLIVTKPSCHCDNQQQDDECPLCKYNLAHDEP